MSKPLEELLSKLYDSERHCTIDWLWDGGVDVILDRGGPKTQPTQSRHVSHPEDLAAAIEEMIGDE